MTVNLRSLMSRARQRAERWLADTLRIRVERLRLSSCCVQLPDRVAYQQRFVQFDVGPGEPVLDIGSGGYPFPPATVLVDRFPGQTTHRHEPLARDGKPLVIAEISQLPF